VADVARTVAHPERVWWVCTFSTRPTKCRWSKSVRGPQLEPRISRQGRRAGQPHWKDDRAGGDCAGFLVNRLLAPYMNEAGNLVTEIEDRCKRRAAIEFGMPMGPLELIDLVGLGVSSHVSENMRAAYGERMEPAPLWKSLHDSANAKSGPPKISLKQTPSAGRLNPAVSKRHMCSHLARPVPLANPSPAVLWQTPADHCPQPCHARPPARCRTNPSCSGWSIPIINEAARCLDEKIVACADDVDLAMVFGTGLPLPRRPVALC